MTNDSLTQPTDNSACREAFERVYSAALAEYEKDVCKDYSFSEIKESFEAGWREAAWNTRTTKPSDAAGMTFEEWFDPCNIGVIGATDAQMQKLANAAWQAAQSAIIEEAVKKLEGDMYENARGDSIQTSHNEALDKAIAILRSMGK